MFACQSTLNNLNKHVFRNFSKCNKSKKWNYLIYISIQTLCSGTRFGQMDPACFNYPWGVTRTWLGVHPWQIELIERLERHILIHIRSHNSHCMSEQKPGHGVQGTHCRLLCRSGQGYKPFLKLWVFPEAQWPHKKFVSTRTVPRVGCPTKLSIRARSALVREVTKNPTVTLTMLWMFSSEMGEPVNRMTSAALCQSWVCEKVAQM